MIQELKKDIYIGGQIRSRKEAQLIFAKRVIKKFNIKVTSSELNKAIDVVSGIQTLDTDFQRIYLNLTKNLNKK